MRGLEIGTIVFDYLEGIYFQRKKVSMHSLLKVQILYTFNDILVTMHMVFKTEYIVM